MIRHTVFHLTVALAMIGAWFGCAPRVDDLRLEGVRLIAREQLGGAPDFEPRTLRYKQFLLVEMSSAVNLALVKNTIYPQAEFCGGPPVGMLMLGPYSRDSVLYRSRTTQIGPKTFRVDSWPLDLKPDPKTSRFLYDFYLVPQRPQSEARPLPATGEFRILAYDLAKDPRNVCLSLRLIQSFASPRMTKAVILSHGKIVAAFDAVGGAPKSDLAEPNRP